MKNFDNWNIKKKKIHSKKGRTYSERDIWWCSMGLNVGFEQDGKGEFFERPVLVVCGLSRYSCFVIPLTTKIENHKMRINIGKIGGSNKESDVIISQMRVMDTRRFTNKIEILDKEKFKEIQKNIRNLF